MAVTQTLTLTEVAGSVDVSNNTSKVRILWQSTQTGESHNYYQRTAKYWIMINGGAWSDAYTVSYQLPQNTTQTILDTTVTVPHKEDGSGTIRVWTEMDTKISAGVVEIDKSLDLTTIARASTITSALDVTLGDNCSVKWTPKAASFRYKLKFDIGNWSYTTGAIHPNKNTEYTYSYNTIPLYVAWQFKTKTDTMTVTLYTYSDSNATSQIGSADSETFTVTVPDNESTKPVVPAKGLVPVNGNLPEKFDGIYIQGRSKVWWQSGSATCQYGATIASYSMYVDGVSYGYADNYTSDYLRNHGTVKVAKYATDSRGHTGVNYEEITVVPYSKPVVQAASKEENIVVARCDKDGNIKDSGTYLKIKAKLIYEKVVTFAGQNNYGKIQYRYRVDGGTWSPWTIILDTTSSTSTEITTAPLLAGTLDIKKNYQVQVQAVDDIDESQPVTFIVPSDDVYMHRPAFGNGMGLGGYAQGTGNLDIYWKTRCIGGMSLFEAGKEHDLGKILPLPRGPLDEGWNPNDIANGVYEVSTYPLKDPMGNVLMETGVLIQLAATDDGFVKIQMAFPTDSFTPVYRIKFYTNWSDWLSFKI